MDHYYELVDLRTGKVTRLALGRKVTILGVNAYAYRAQFWSPDYQTFLVHPGFGESFGAQGKAAFKQLAFVHLSPRSVRLWGPDNGGYPESWLWSDTKSGSGFWVLVSHPGELYRLGRRQERKLRLPALDNAPTTMLSPKLDRAVAFRNICVRGYRVNVQGYVVDFSKPELERAIKISGRKDMGRLSMGWGAWSPDGSQVALLLTDRTKDGHFALYVGDPAHTLRKIPMPQGFQFSDWLTEDGKEGPPSLFVCLGRRQQNHLL